MSEIEALKNAANDLELFVHEQHATDKRKTVKMYFLTQNGTTISPTLDYDKMNHFILGFRKGNKPTSEMTAETLTKLRNRQPLRLFDKSEKLFHTIQLNRLTSFTCWQRFVSKDRKNWQKWNETLTLKDVNQIIEQIKSNKTK